MKSAQTIKTLERRHWRRSGVFIVNFEQILHVVLVFPLLTLNKQMLVGLFPLTSSKTDKKNLLVMIYSLFLITQNHW